ncbi:hypothetical protein XENTR_v10009313 [Xenopus tropicalis]|nr:hypothetical protein XENTR_v10009313 [Xenopus tropicalis]
MHFLQPFFSYPILIQFIQLQHFKVCSATITHNYTWNSKQRKSKTEWNSSVNHSFIFLSSGIINAPFRQHQL